MKRLLISFLLIVIVAFSISAQQPTCNPGDTLTPPCQAKQAVKPRKSLITTILRLLF